MIAQFIRLNRPVKSLMTVHFDPEETYEPSI